MRKFLADTVALIAYSTVAGFLIELLIAGMTLAQSAQARLTAIPIVVLTARPYGLYRDWVFRVSHANQSRQLGQAIADIVAFVTFQIPVYILILLLAGASITQMIAACSSSVGIMVVSGRPYGLFLELCRRIFRVAN